MPVLGDFSDSSFTYGVVRLNSFFVTLPHPLISFFFFFKDPAPPEISPLPLPAALPIPARFQRREPRRSGEGLDLPFEQRADRLRLHVVLLSIQGCAGIVHVTCQRLEARKSRLFGEWSREGGHLRPILCTFTVGCTSDVRGDVPRRRRSRHRPGDLAPGLLQPVPAGPDRVRARGAGPRLRGRRQPLARHRPARSDAEPSPPP